MNRFMGMMPCDKVEREEKFKVGLGGTVTIQAGKDGWTILYADNSSEYKDVIDTTDNNFNKAMEVLKTHFDNISNIK